MIFILMVVITKKLFKYKEYNEIDTSLIDSFNLSDYYLIDLQNQGIVGNRTNFKWKLFEETESFYQMTGIKINPTDRTPLFERNLLKEENGLFPNGNSYYIDYDNTRLGYIIFGKRWKMSINRRWNKL